MKRMPRGRGVSGFGCASVRRQIPARALGGEKTYRKVVGVASVGVNLVLDSLGQRLANVFPRRDRGAERTVKRRWRVVVPDERVLPQSSQYVNKLWGMSW